MFIKKIIICALFISCSFVYSEDVEIEDENEMQGNFLSEIFIEKLINTKSFIDSITNRENSDYHDVVTIRNRYVSCVSGDFKDSYGADIDDFKLYKDRSNYYLKDANNYIYRKLLYGTTLADVILEKTELLNLYINENCFIKERSLYINNVEYFLNYRSNNIPENIDFVFTNRSHNITIGIINDIESIIVCKLVKKMSDEELLPEYGDHVPVLIINEELYKYTKRK